MKYLYLFLSSCLILLPLITLNVGCTTTGGSSITITPQSLENKSKAVAWVATTKLLADHPDWRPYFETALADLRILEASDTIGVVEVLAIVQRLPVKQLQNENTSLIIGGTMLFFQDELNQMSVDTPENLKAVVRGMISGLTLAGVGG